MNNRHAILGGIFSALITAAGTIILGEISGYEAKILIKNSIPGVNTLCNTVVLASATILALLLTLLSISSSSSSKLKKIHYKNVLQIAKLDTVVFVVAMITFLLLNIPVTESDTIPINYYSYIYYISLGIASLLSGGIISVVLMLYNTVNNIIQIVGLGNTSHPMLYHEENEEEDK